MGIMQNKKYTFIFQLFDYFKLTHRKKPIREIGFDQLFLKKSNNHIQRHINIATCSIRVRTNDMCGIDQLLRFSLL